MPTYETVQVLRDIPVGFSPGSSLQHQVLISLTLSPVLTLSPCRLISLTPSSHLSHPVVSSFTLPSIQRKVSTFPSGALDPEPARARSCSGASPLHLGAYFLYYPSLSRCCFLFPWRAPL